jgi:hypothetical protein
MRQSDRLILIVAAAIVGSLAATPASYATTKVPCFDATGTTFLGGSVRPKACAVLKTDGSFGNYFFRLRWTSYGAKSASARGETYREWADSRIRFERPRRRCGRLVFTRVSVRYVGYGDADKRFRYAIKGC